MENGVKRYVYFGAEKFEIHAYGGSANSSWKMPVMGKNS